MRWLMRHRLRAYVRGSAWLAPAAAIPAALVMSPAVRRIDALTQWRLMDYTPEAARSLLSAITPATLTFIVLILTTLLLTVQLASSQLSPRLIAGLLSRRPVKFCLAVFVLSYVFCAATLGRIEDRVPQLSIVVAIALTLISVGAGLFLIDYLAKELRPVRMLARTAGVGRAVIEQVYPTFASSDTDVANPDGRWPLAEPYETILHVERSGILRAMDLDGLAALAADIGGAVEVVPEVGDFVARGDALFRVHPGSKHLTPAQFYARLALGDERTAEQDPTFVLRILVDVACKALSPAINDPTTAVLAIDQVHHLLRQVGMRRLDTGEVRDASGNLRVLYRTPDWDDFVLLGVAEIRQYGAQSIQVVRRLRAMLENLIGLVPHKRRETLREQLRLLQSGVRRHFNEPEDRARADTGDLQGVGGSQNGQPARTNTGPPHSDTLDQSPIAGR